MRGQQHAVVIALVDVVVVSSTSRQDMTINVYRRRRSATVVSSIIYVNSNISLKRLSQSRCLSVCLSVSTSNKLLRSHLFRHFITINPLTLFTVSLDACVLVTYIMPQ